MADENTVYIIVALSGTAKNDVIFEDQFWGGHCPTAPTALRWQQWQAPMVIVLVC